MGYSQAKIGFSLGDTAGDIFETVTDAITTPVNAVGDLLDQIPVIGPYIAPAILTLTGQPELAAAYIGERAANKTGDPLSGVFSGLGAYAGNALGSSLGSTLGDTFGGQAGSFLNSTPANAIGNAFGGGTLSGLGAGFGSAAGNALGSSTIGSIAGGALGSNIGAQFGENIGGGAQQQPAQATPLPLAALGGTPFSPSRSPSMGLPQSLSQFSNLSQDQLTSNIATKGIYGGGNGPEESKYFLNLINNQLVDQTGKVGDSSTLPSIDKSYLAQLGIGGNNANDILKGISNYAG